MTIRDVAARAGVSPATVSRVFSQPDAVTPETRQEVLAATGHVVVAVHLLDTQPHAVAVQAQRAYLAASQRCRQPGREQIDHVAVLGVDVLNPARFHCAERIGPRGQ